MLGILHMPYSKLQTSGTSPSMWNSCTHSCLPTKHCKPHYSLPRARQNEKNSILKVNRQKIRTEVLFIRILDWFAFVCEFPDHQVAHPVHAGQQIRVVMREGEVHYHVLEALQQGPLRRLPVDHSYAITRLSWWWKYKSCVIRGVSVLSKSKCTRYLLSKCMQQIQICAEFV